jgi:hypothetical protein
MFCGSESFKDIVGMKKRYTGKWQKQRHDTHTYIIIWRIIQAEWTRKKMTK